MSAPTGKLKFAYDSIANLEQQIATLRAKLSAAEARADELSAMLDHQRDEATEMERMLRAGHAKAEARAERLAIFLARYRNETPLGNQPHMLAHLADAALAEGEAG